MTERTARPVLMTVHAHPDDESIGTGGILLRYHAEGVRTVLVTCTGGECGEISDPALATPANLGEARARELAEAVAILGVDRLVWLGYRDSGMAGTAENEHPASFHRADLDAATERLVRIIRAERPTVIVTYDANGTYGHPDHIKAHRVTVAAFEAAGDPARFPTAGRPWTPSRLYFTAISRGALERFGEALRASGFEPPSADGNAARDGVLRFALPDEAITTRVDVAGFVDEKRRAIMVHRTQMGPDGPFARMPAETFRDLWTAETFVRAVPPLPAPVEAAETDLFAGLPWAATETV